MKLKGSSKKGIVEGFADAGRSSLFLATFISLFYASVCASRTTVGPWLYGSDPVSHQFLDSGLWLVILLPASREMETPA